MEKLMIILWGRPELAADGLRDALADGAAQQLLALPAVRGLRLAVVDSAVAPASDKRLASDGELPDAVVSLWLDQAAQRQQVESILRAYASRLHSYLVCEAEPIPNTSQPPDASHRVPGMCQVVFLQQPPRLSRQQWLDIWQLSHTDVAIATQGTFGYRQNLVVRALDPAAPVIDAVVEENFPDQAMSSDLAFYGAADAADLQTRQEAMMTSCARFIDFDKIDVIPMSEYLFKPAAAP